jgi:hypothetical protein
MARGRGRLYKATGSVQRMMSKDDFATLADRAMEISIRIRPMLAGHEPALTGAVLADLVSIWLAGHHPGLRNGILTDWLDILHKLVPVSERQIFQHGKPPGW